MSFIIPSPLPPWTPSQITIDTTLPSKKLTNDYEHTHFFFHELLIKYHSSSKYFTDGSKFSSFIGCSIIHPDSYITRFSLPSSFSILSAELYAIYLAINSVVQSSNNNVCIFSDSLPVILNFRNPTHTIPQLILHTLTRRAFLKIVLIWIPATPKFLLMKLLIKQRMNLL